jgi:hypothetical protein
VLEETTMRRVFCKAAVLVGLASFVGCAGDLEVPRSDIVIDSINGGDPLQSSIREAGDDQALGTADDFIPEDEVYVSFRNTPSHQGTTEPTGPFSDVTFNRYRVSYVSTPALAEIIAGTHVRVASGDTAGVRVVVVPAVRKQMSPLVDIYTGGQQPIEASAHIEFWGEEKTSGEEVYVDGWMPVNFDLYQGTQERTENR